jgi:hypothetical protein
VALALEDEPIGPSSLSHPRPRLSRRAKRGAAFSTSCSATFPPNPRSKPDRFRAQRFHVDEEQRFQPLPPPAPERATPSCHERDAVAERATPSRHERATPSRHERPARHFLPEEQLEKRPFWFESDGRHSREGPDDASTYGRHSMPGRD